MSKEELLKELSQEMQSLRAEAFAAAIGEPKWKVYRMVKNGHAPRHFNIGKEIRFPLAAVRKWWEARKGEC